MEGLKQAYQTWQVETKPQLNHDLAQRIASGVETYMQNLDHDLSNISDAQSRTRFKNKYLRSFWTILATREQTVPA